MSTIWYGTQTMYGNYTVRDLKLHVKAVAELRANTWDGETPVFFDGVRWSDTVRELATISLMNALRANTSARSLVVRNADLELKAQKAMAEVFQGSKALRSVTLKNLRYAGSSMAIPVALFQNQALSELNIAQCFIDNAGCLALARMLRSSDVLKSLTLTNVTFGGEFSHVCAAISSSQSLTHFTLQNFRLTGEDMSDLLRAVGRSKTIECIVFERLGISSEHKEDLASMISGSKTLSDLSLRRNNIGGDCMEYICEKGLACNESLRALDLSYNAIGDDGARSLNAYLQKFSNLRRLCLMECEIWLPGCKAMCVGLAQYKGLRVLYLDGNEVDHVYGEIISSLSFNTKIHHILGTMPRLMQVGEENNRAWRQVDFLLRQNKAKRRFLMETNFDQRLLPLILVHANDQPDVMFEFLRQMPRQDSEADILGKGDSSRGSNRLYQTPQTSCSCVSLGDLSASSVTEENECPLCSTSSTSPSLFSACA